QRPQGDVGQIADGRGYQIERWRERSRGHLCLADQVGALLFRSGGHLVLALRHLCHGWPAVAKAAACSRSPRARSATTASSTIIPLGVTRSRELPTGSTSPSSCRIERRCEDNGRPAYCS